MGIKRIIGALLAATMFAGMSCAAYAKERSDVKKEADFLFALGVYAPPGYGDEVYTQQATRGEFISAVMHMAYRQMIDGDVGGMCFLDVSEDSSYYKEILAAKNIGLVSGMSNERFAPDEGIAPAHALGIMKKVLGYESVADSSLVSRGLCSGVDMSAQSMSIGDMIRFLYNALEIDKMCYMGNNTYQVVKGETILAADLNVSDVSGIVTENEYTALYNADGTGSKNIVSVNGMRYDCSSYDMTDYLGCNVKIYYKSSDDGSRPEVIFVKDKDCEHVSFDSDDIISFENNAYTVQFADSGKRKSYRIQSDAAIIYNGVAESGLSHIKPEYGSVELVDNDSDGRYDVVKITEYETYFVSGIYAEDYIIYSGDKILKFDEETKVIQNGEEAMFKTIAPMSVVLVRESANKTGIKLRVIEKCQEKFEGIISHADEDKVILGEKEYKINPALKTFMPVNKEGTFYFDSRGRVAHFTEKVISNEKYGYLMRAANEEFDSAVLILTESSDKERYVLEDTVTLDGRRKDAQEVCIELRERNELIRYRLSKNGKVNYIDTTDDGGYLKKIPYTGASTTFMFRSRSNAFSEYKNANGNFLNGTMQYFIDRDTKVFYKGKDKFDSKNFGAGSMADFINDSEYSVEGYDLKQNGVCGAIVVDAGGDGMKYIYRYNYILYVSKVTKTISDDNEEYYLIKGIYAGAEVEYKILAQDFANASQIQSGDMIQFRANDRNELTAINYVYRKNGNIPEGFGKSDIFVTESDGLRGSASDTALIVLGKSVNRYANVIELEYVRDAAEQRAMFDVSAGTCIEYSDGRYSVNSARDLPAVCTEGQLMMIHVRSGGTFEIVFIKE